MDHFKLGSCPEQGDIAALYPTKKDLKSKYRELVKYYHPDKKTGDTGEFQRIDAVYRELLLLYTHDDDGGKFKFPAKRKTENNRSSNPPGSASSPAAEPARPKSSSARPKSENNTTTSSSSSATGAENSKPGSKSETGSPKPDFDPFSVSEDFDPFSSGAASSNWYEKFKQKRSQANSPEPGHANANNDPTSKGDPSNSSNGGKDGSNGGKNGANAGNGANSNADTWIFDPFTGERLNSNDQPDFPEVKRNYDTEGTSSEDEKIHRGLHGDYSGANYPQDASELHFGDALRVVEVIIMGFRNVEKPGTYKIEVALDGRSQQMIHWTKLPGKEQVHCSKLENFTFFRWNPGSYIQFILHGQRTFRMNKRAGEAHLAVRNLLQTHDGRYEGWIMLEHKGRRFAEVLVAINMEGPEIRAKKSPTRNTIVVAVQRSTDERNRDSQMQQQAAFQQQQFPMLQPGSPYYPRPGSQGGGQLMGGHYAVALTASPGNQSASVYAHSAPTSPNPFHARPSSAGNPFGGPVLAGYYDSPTPNYRHTTHAPQQGMQSPMSMMAQQRRSSEN